MPTRSTASPLIVMAVRASLSMLDAARRQRRRHVVIVVVIAEDSVDAVRRRQRRQRIGGGTDVLSVAPRHVIAAEHDQVGLFVHQQRHGVNHVVVRDPAAAVDVGEQSDLEAGQRRRQADDRQVDPRHPELVPLVQIAVRASYRHAAETCREKRLEDDAPTDRHRLL